MAADSVYVTFGADTGSLEAAFALAKAQTVNLANEVRALAREMTQAGAAADQGLKDKLTEAAAKFAEAKANVAGLKDELRGSGGEAEAGFLGGTRRALETLLAPILNVKLGLKEVSEIILASFAVERIVEFVKSMTELGEQTVRASTLLGVPTNQIAALNVQAQASGSSLEELSRAVARLGLNLEKGAAGSKPVIAALDSLGLKAKEFIDLPIQEKLGTLAEKFAQLENGPTKDAIAMTLLGKAGQDMLPFLNKGAEGLQEFNDIADRSGAEILPSMAGALERTKLITVEASSAMQGLGLAIYNQLSGPIDGAVKLFDDMVEAITSSINEGGIWAGVLESLSDLLKVVERSLVETIRQIANFNTEGTYKTREVQIAFETLGKSIADVFRALSGGAGAFFAAIGTAAQEAARVTGQAFAHVGEAIAAGLHGDAGGAEAALAKIPADAEGAAARIKAAFAGTFDFSQVGADMEQGAEIIRRTDATMQQEIVANNERAATELKAIDDDVTNAAIANVGRKKPILELPSAGAAKAAKEAAVAAKAGYDDDLDALRANTLAKEKLLQEQLKTHQISMTQYVTASIDAYEDEKQDIEGVYADELADARLTASQKVEIKRQELKEIEAITQKEADVQAKAAEASVKEWDAATKQINSAFDAQISGLLKGTESFKTALAKIFVSLTTDVIKFFVNWALKAVENEALQLASQNAITAGIVSALGLQGAAQATAAKAGILTAIAADSGEAFAGFTAFFAPTLGPGAPAAAAALTSSTTATATGLAGLDVGGSVLSSGYAVIHAGEEVVPAARVSTPYSGNGSQGASNSGPPVHFHISAIDARGVAQFVKENAGLIAKTVAGHQNSNPSSRGAF